MSAMRVYLIAADPYDGWTKIGRTGGHDRHRLVALQVGNPRLLRCVVSWESHGPDFKEFGYRDAEGVFHRHFAQLRGCGEWFALPLGLLGDAVSTADEPVGYLKLLERWPVERVLALAVGESTPEALARQFAAPATNPTTPKLRIVADAG